MEIKSTQQTINVSSGGVQISSSPAEPVEVSRPQITESYSNAGIISDEYVSTIPAEGTSQSRSNSGDRKDIVGGEIVQKEATGVSEKILRDKVRAVNELLKETNREFSVAVHEKTKSIMVKVIDPDTKKVIKEFPPEKIQDMAAKMMEMAGLLVDEKR